MSKRFFVLKIINKNNIFANKNINKSTGFFATENITLINNGRKELFSVANKSLNIKLNSTNYTEIKNILPEDALMCDKSIGFLVYIGNIIDFVYKIAMVDDSCIFDDFSGIINKSFSERLRLDSANDFFIDCESSVFISIDEDGRVSYSVHFTNLSFRVISLYNENGEHFYIFDVLGDSKNKYIINSINDLSIIKKYILEKSSLYEIMKNYGYEITSDINNEDLSNIVKISTMASN